MSGHVKPTSSKVWTSGSGLFLILVSLGVAVFDSSNFLAMGLAFLVLMIGIALVMMGFLGTQDMQKKGSVHYSEITREIVKIRCSHCNALNFETSSRCTNCGANL